ncbi:unnamed protein product [Phaeothamnion confervicola]
MLDSLVLFLEKRITDKFFVFILFFSILIVPILLVESGVEKKVFMFIVSLIMLVRSISLTGLYNDFPDPIRVLSEDWKNYFYFFSAVWMWICGASWNRFCSPLVCWLVLSLSFVVEHPFLKFFQYFIWAYSLFIVFGTIIFTSLIENEFFSNKLKSIFGGNFIHRAGFNVNAPEKNLRRMLRAGLQTIVGVFGLGVAQIVIDESKVFVSTISENAIRANMEFPLETLEEYKTRRRIILAGSPWNWHLKELREPPIAIVEVMPNSKSI